ncbi:MAG: tRNA (adenosine(37)-N6)-threonylcarbamoyltransferase complex dimerization subunit type 1 TsaB [Hyphomicrobiaceae bacterium]
MRLLAIDTCFGGCSAAVAADGAILASAYRELRTGHAEALVPMIGRVLDDAGLAPRDIDRIAVTQGPGTFAGMRIGLAAAEGLRMATAAVLVPVSSLWAIGQRVLAERRPDIGPRRLAVVVDAGRGQVYVEILDGEGRSTGGPMLAAIDAVAGQLAGRPTALAGSGARLLAKGEHAKVILDGIEPRAADFARPASLFPEYPRPVRPLYFRPADAVVQAPPAGLRA